VDLHLLLTLVLDEGEWPAFTTASLPSGTELPVRFNGRLGEPQIRSGHFGGETKLFPILGIKPRFLGLQARTLFSTPITFSWLLAENLDEEKTTYIYNSFPVFFFVNDPDSDAYTSKTPSRRDKLVILF
jgi:hypothetical protein